MKDKVDRIIEAKNKIHDFLVETSRELGKEEVHQALTFLLADAALRATGGDADLAIQLIMGEFNRDRMMAISELKQHRPN